LKLFTATNYSDAGYCFREKSTKTRIETRLQERGLQVQARVLEKNPPKQGLKQRRPSLFNR